MSTGQEKDVSSLHTSCSLAFLTKSHILSFLDVRWSRDLVRDERLERRILHFWHTFGEDRFVASGLHHSRCCGSTRVV